MTDETIKVVHIESGLGNQMLDYAELLAVKKANPKAECFMETIISQLPDAGKAISQWNGFELDRIFENIKDNDVKILFSGDEWNSILKDVDGSRFWEDHWNYPPAINGAFERHGLKLANRCRSLSNYRLEDPGYKLSFKEKIRLSITMFFRTPIGNAIKRKLKKMTQDTKLRDVRAQRDMLFTEREENEFIGHNMTFMYKDSGIERIDKEIRTAFVFPEIKDERNLKMLKYLREVNSVAIHARRGDMLSNQTTAGYYRFGYFKRAVKYIRKNVSDPVFVFFCDPGSEKWCRENMQIFALDPSKDKVEFVNWNKGENSYIDMQLMSCCKHNIITNSSFGWWGAYLNNNPKKITISPEYPINTTVTV